MTEEEVQVDPKDPLGVRNKKPVAESRQPAPVGPAPGADPLGVRKKKVDSGGSSTTGLDISPAANYRQSLADYTKKTEEIQNLEQGLTKLKGDIDKQDILQSDPVQVENFKNLTNQYNSLTQDYNRRATELRNLKVLVDKGQESYRQDNSNRQDKLFEDMGLSGQEAQQIRNQIFKQLNPDQAKDVDEGRLIPNINDVDAEDLAKALTGQTTEQIKVQKKLEENRSITDRVFGTFGRSIEKTLAFELPASLAGTIQNVLSDVKIKPEDLEKSSLAPGISHQLKKVIDLVPGATKAINEQVDDARVAAFEWADYWRNAPTGTVPTPFGGFTLTNDQNLIRSISQIERPLDVVDFVFSNAGQGVAQIVPAVLSRGTTSAIQEIGNNQLEGTIEIARQLSEKEGRVVTPEEVIRKDLDEPVTARNFGIIQAGLEAFSAGKVVKMLGYESVKKDLKERALTWYKEAFKAGKSEFFTEGTQGALGQLSVNKMTGLGTIDAVKKIDWFQVLDESIAGMVGGASVSAGGSAVNASINRIGLIKGVVEKPEKTVEEQAAVEDFLNSVVDVAKKNGDPRSPEEIKSFVQGEVLEKVEQPKEEAIETVTPEVEVEEIAPEVTPEEVAPPAEEVLEQEAVTEEVPVSEEGVLTPMDLAKQYFDEVQSPTAVQSKDAAIARTLEGVRVNEDSLMKTIGDKNSLTNSIAKSYIRSKGGTAIDQVAQDISMQINPQGDGTDVSPEDVWDFMKRYPNGAGAVFQPSGNEVLRNINEQYKTLTGKALNRNIARMLTEKDRKTREATMTALAKPFEEITPQDAEVLADLHVTEKQGEFEQNMALREEFQRILDGGISTKTFQSEEIKKFLDSDAFTDAEKETINYIFDYARINPGGAQEIDSYFAERNKRLGKEAQGFQAVSGFRENFESSKEFRAAEQRAEEERIKLVRELFGDPDYMRDLTKKEEQPTKKRLKGATKPKVKKSDKVRAELDELTKELNAVLGNTLSSGVNPQAAVIGAKIVAKYVELGVTKFAEMAQDIYAEFGEDAFRKYFQSLKAGYGSVLATSDDTNLTSLEDLRKAKVEDFIQIEKDDAVTTGDLEPDSGRNKPTEQVGKEDVPVKRPASRSGVGKRSGGTKKAKSGRESDSGFSDRIPPTSGEQPDPGLATGEQSVPVAERIGRGSDTDGSGAVDVPGIQPEPNTAEQPTKNTGVQIEAGLSLDQKIQLQKQADKSVKVIPQDKANIAESVPLLMPHQVENVYKAERRFLNPPTTPDGVNKGILFTDATGTGKTYTGLGIIKRMVLMGVKDVLLVVPTDAKIKDWQDEGKHFGLTINALKDTKDAGAPGSIVITTYANFRQNPALLERAEKNPFGLTMYDESHKLVSNQDGESTAADDAHKAITNAPNNSWMRAKAKFKTMWEKANGENGTYEQRKKVDELIAAETKRLTDLTKVVFLSATPFAYHKNLLYADGYLFKIMQGEINKPGDSYKSFFVSNFGYRIRYSKLTAPEAQVDVGLMERAFHTKLIKEGAVSSTRLQLDKDYSREFVLLDDKLGSTIDEGYKLASDSNKFKYLSSVISKKFTFLYENQLLEAIKAKISVERIQQHLDMGRKVVLFHTYNNSLPSHPFDFTDTGLYPEGVPPQEVRDEINRFNDLYPEYHQLDLRDLKNPIETIVNAFGKRVVLFNGNISKENRKQAIRQFNQDEGDTDIMVVQMEAGQEGISLHDVSGKRQRALLNLGLPVRPTAAIQTEGRIYRIGQMSNAIIEYPVLHLNFEKIAFANKINTRASTAENLAFGEQSRNLKEAFKEGYKNPILEAPNDKQGVGGRDADFVYESIDQFAFARTLYYSRQKRNAKTKAREGTDYYATPEPLGFKVAQWLYPKPNMTMLEPSAGHGAIARWFPENTKNKFIEPSYELRADMGINVNGEVVGSTFEDLHIINKFDRIAMNPPFGHAGKTAWDHTVKALGHLSDGGRVITIVPDGPSMQKYIDKWLESEDSKDFFITAKIRLPGIAFHRAGTSVRTQLLIIDKQTNEEVQKKLPQGKEIDLTSIEDINQLFDRIKEMEMPEPLVPLSSSEIAAKVVLDTLQQAPKIKGDAAQVVAGIHTKFGHKIWTVRLLNKVSEDDFKKAHLKAKTLRGRWSSFKGNKAIPGFIFEGDNGPDNANKLSNFINAGMTDEGMIDPSDVQERAEGYGMMSSRAKDTTIAAAFEQRTVNNAEGNPFKMYNEVIDLSKKYNPGSTLGQGHTMRGTIGSFYTPSTNVRVTGLTDLSVAMHELVHALDFKNGVIQKFIDSTKPGDPIRKRLTDLYLQYYPKAQPGHAVRTRMVEGYATLVQKYIEFPTAIEAEYKDLVDAFLTPGGPYWLDDVGNFIQDVSYVIAKYQKLNPLSKMSARITNDVIDQPKKSFLTAADKVTYEIFDKIAPIEKLAKMNGTHLTADDVSTWIRLSNNALQLAEKNISSKRQRFWQMDKKGEWKEKHNFNYYTLVNSLDKRGLQDEFAAYLYGRRLKFEYDELNDLEAELDTLQSPQHLEFIMSSMDLEVEAALQVVAAQTADVQKEIDRLASILENEGVSEQEANEAYTAGQDMFANDEKMYDILVQEDLEFAHNPLVQLLDKEGYDKFKERKGYASFKRATYDELVGNQDVPAIQTSGKTVVSQFLTRRGSTKPVLNPLMAAMMNHSELIRKGMQQMVYNKFLDVAEKHPDLFQVLTLKVSPDSSNRYPQSKDPNIIMARKDYNRVPILADAQIKQVLHENYDYHNAHLLERVGVNMSQLFRTGTTGIFWQFFINNTFIDQLAASVNTRNGMFPFLSSIRQIGPIALRAISRGALFPNSPEAAYLKEYLFLAGASQTFLSADIEGIKQLKRIIKDEDKTVLRRMNGYFETILKWMSTPGNATEIMTRGTEYILARKAGKPQVVALEEAGRVSAPFHHVGRFGGGVGRSYVRTVPYFNASLQVLKTTKETLSTKKGRVRYAFAALSMVATAVSSTLYLMRGEDDEEDERLKLLTSLAPDNLTKYLYFPNPYSKKRLIQIRVPENIAWLAGLTNMMMIESAGKTKYDWSEYGEAGSSFLPTQLNPFNPTQMLYSYIPQALKPSIETLTGQKVYPNVRPIETTRDASLPPELRYNKYTAPGAIILGDTFGWSPKKIEHFISGTFGRASRYVLGKPGAYGLGDIFEKELYLEASRQVQYFYDVKKRTSQQIKAYDEDLQTFTPEEVDLMYQQDALVSEIEGLLETYKELDDESPAAAQTRNLIFQQILELENLE